MIPTHGTSTHPGEMLLEEFLKPLAITCAMLAKDLEVPEHEVAALVACKRSVTDDMAARLAAHFKTSATFWLNLQAAYDQSCSGGALST